MGDAPEQEGTEGDMDHGLGDIDAGFVVAHEAAPSGHPAEGALDHPTPWQDFEACLFIGAPDDFDDEVEEGGLVHELAPVIGAVGEKMLQPRPAFADRIEDHLGACGIGDIGGGQVDHQEPPIGVDGDMAFAAHDLLPGVVASLFGARRLDRLAVDDARRGACFATETLAIRHQGNIMDGAEQELPQEAAEPPIHRLPGRKVAGQHLPAAAGANQIADRVHHLAQIGLARPAAFARRRKQRRYHRPFLVGHVRRVAFELLSDLGQAATRLFVPHEQRESRHPLNRKVIFQKVS